MARYKTHRWHEYDDPNDYRAIYSQNWSAFAQQDRDDATIEMGRRFSGITSIADMSAGGSRITPTLAEYFEISNPTLGDFWDGYDYRYSGPILETVPALDPVDLFVCTETLEHLYEPDEALKLIRSKTRFLLATTPIMETPELVSHGHLWTWEREDVEAMFTAAGFEMVEFQAVSLFGLWRCR